MIDFDSLKLVLSQKDLELRWHIGRSASGSQLLEKAPEKANFFWIRDTLLIHGIEVAKDELEDLIKTLEDKGLKVPHEFHAALGKLPAE